MRILILGQGKSGTTLLYYALQDAVREATGRQPQQAFEPRDLRKIGPRNRYLVAKKLIGTMSDDEVGALSSFDAVVWIERDPRDVLLSRFLYNFRHRPLAQQADALSEMLELLRKKEQRPGSVDFCELIDRGRELDGVDVVPVIEREQVYATGLWADLQLRVVPVRYDDMLDGAMADLDRAIGVHVDPRRSDIPYPRNRVARTRSSGDWRNWFTARDVKFLRPRLRPIAFIPQDWDDWQVNANPRIDPEYGSAYIRRLLAGD